MLNILNISLKVRAKSATVDEKEHESTVFSVLEVGGRLSYLKVVVLGAEVTFTGARTRVAWSTGLQTER